MRYTLHQVKPQVAAQFTGLATYDDFVVIDRDMSQILLLVAPFQTPFLDLLGPAPRAATSIKHEWTEQNIGPDRIICSTAINSNTAATGVQVNGKAHYLQVGMMLELEAPSGNSEVVQISSIPGPNSLLLTRNVGVNGYGVNSLVAGGTLFVISTVEKEGADTDGDVSVPRAPLTNWTQIFKKPIKLSGSRQAVLTIPNVGSEIDNQEAIRTIEMLRDLEKAVIRSVAISTTGDDNTYRSMNGLRKLITTINSTVSVTTMAADPLYVINQGLARAWDNGARDVDLLLCGANWGGLISQTNAGRVQAEQSDYSVQRIIETVATDFGVVRKLISPWMPPNSMMGLATGRIFVPPLQGRNFQRQQLAKTGDSDKRHVIGEYTLELHHEEQMFQFTQA